MIPNKTSETKRIAGQYSAFTTQLIRGVTLNETQRQPQEFDTFGQGRNPTILPGSQGRWAVETINPCPILICFNVSSRCRAQTTIPELARDILITTNFANYGAHPSSMWFIMS